MCPNCEGQANIFGGVQRAAATVEKHIPRPAIRLHFRNLTQIIEGEQEISTRVLAGSVPPGNDDLWNEPYDGRLRIHTLDKFYKSVTFVKGGKYGPPMLPKIVNIAERIVQPVPSDFRAY